jgi:hypothetical protein
MRSLRIALSIGALLLPLTALAGGSPAKKALRAVEDAIDEVKESDKDCRRAVLEDLEDAADKLEGKSARLERALRALKDARKAAEDDCPKKVTTAIRDAIDELEDAEDDEDDGGGRGKLLLDDNFDDNRSSWWVGAVQEADAGIQDGRMWLRHNVAGGYVSWVKRPLRDRGDYRVELTLRISEDLDNYGCGLYFGALDGNNGYTFEVGDEGQYRLSYFEGGQWKDVTGWQGDKAVKAAGAQWVTVGVAKQGKKWNLLVNGKTVDDIPARAFFGEAIGVRVEARMTCEFDRLRVWGE